MIKQFRTIIQTKKVYIAVKHLNPCFQTTSVQNKYLEVLFGKCGAYKSEYTLKNLLSQNMVHLLETQSKGHQLVLLIQLS